MYKKTPWHLLPFDALREVANVLGHGVIKHGVREWEEGLSWEDQFSALMRHLTAWWEGEDNDPESGYSHLAHAGCRLLFLLASQKRGIGIDNRP